MKRKGGFRRFARKAARTTVRYAKKARKSFGKSSKQLDLFDPMPIGYGFARPMAEQYLPKIDMLGAYSDNALLLGAAYGVHKLVKNKLGQDLAKTMVVCEKFLIGNDLNAQFLGQTASKSSGGTSQEFVYG